jgi:hypothetical protein
MTAQGIFAVSRKHILQRPKAFYENLRDAVGKVSNPGKYDGQRM